MWPRSNTTWRDGGDGGSLRVSLKLAVAAAFIGLLAGPAAAREYHAGAVRVLDPWVRATSTAGADAVGFLTITNDGLRPARLTAAECPIAASTSIHDSGEASLGDIAIAPGQTVKLTPGGPHLVLVGTKHRLVRGDTISCRLAFDSGTVEVDLLVRSAHAIEPLMGPMESK
jgi:copper(I)-binding protein